MRNLIDDQLYTKSDAVYVYALLEVASLIELEEKKVEYCGLTGVGEWLVH
ncbi:hypothetical protein ACUL41_03510 [Virgibacillus natechei]